MIGIYPQFPVFLRTIRFIIFSRRSRPKGRIRIMELADLIADCIEGMKTQAEAIGLKGNL